MINGYYRPRDLEEAIALLTRTDGDFRAMGGGAAVSQDREVSFSVVDLQQIGLSSLVREGQFLQIGATTTLQDLMSAEGIQSDLREAIRLEAGANIRQQATIAGTLVTAAGRSTFGTAMMALDATLHWMPGMQDQSVGEWFTLRESPSIAKLIVRIQIPLNVSLAFDSIGRSPADLPILCAAVAKWPSGRTRIALGGFGKSPILALDAPDSGGFDAAVLNALAHSDDQWASSAYRREAGLPLVKRLINRDNTALDMDSPEGLQ